MLPRSIDLSRHHPRALAGLVAAAIAFLPTALAAQDSLVRLTQRAGSSVRLDGTTTIRAGWRCTSDQPDAVMELDTRRSEAADALIAALARSNRVAPGLVQRIRLRVPVTDLDCGNPLAARALRRALHSQDVVGEFRVATGSVASAGGVKVTGKLTVAGVTRDVTLDVATAWGSDGTVRASGSLPLHLSDFGIEPPRVLFSAVRASDTLTVSFDLLLGAAEGERSGIVAQATPATARR